jgi:rod shape-determining protein MreC
MSSRANAWYLLVLFAGLGFVVFSAGRCAVRPAESLLPAIMPVQRGLTESADSVRNFIAGLTRGWQLEAENRALREELQRITGEIARLRQAESDNEDLRTLLQFQRANSQWNYIGASVVSFDGQRLAQTVVIDRGADQGVEEGLIVVVAGGLVGKVTELAQGIRSTSLDRSTQRREC